MIEYTNVSLNIKGVALAKTITTCPSHLIMSAIHTAGNIAPRGLENIRARLHCTYLTLHSSIYLRCRSMVPIWMYKFRVLEKTHSSLLSAAIEVCNG